MTGLRRRKPDIPGLLPVFVLVIGLLLVSPALSSPPTAVMEAPTSPFAVADDQATGLLDLQHHYQQMNRDLAKQAAGVGDEPTAHEAIQIARLALQQRETLLQELGHGHSSAFFAQQHRNLNLSTDLIRIMEDEHPSKLHESVELAKRATKWQTASLGLDWADSVPFEGHEKPSTALLELTARHQAVPDEHELQRIVELDSHPEPLRLALARFVDAFLAFETAAQNAYAEVDVSKVTDKSNRLDLQAELIQALRTDPVGILSTGERFQEQGIDLSLLLPSRNQFLDAIVDLHAALEDHELVQSAECDPVQVPPVFSLDLTHCDNHYTENFVLVLDAGGNDTYHNNAGGNGIGPECDVFRAAAALVDLGEGDNEIGDPDNPLSCGINGGGLLGSGILVSSQGNNSYAARDRATNGGGELGGTGLLVDNGSSVFEAGNRGTNGGGVNGIGTLVNSAKNSYFLAGSKGSNGGGYTGGIGFVTSGGGISSYQGNEEGTNGGGYLGIGFLLAQEGDKDFSARGLGTNGGGSEGVGFLISAGGNDIFQGGGAGANGGATGFAQETQSVGMLINFYGDDVYLGDSNGVNGGGSLFGSGFLLDFSGNDVFRASNHGVNGGAVSYSTGLLINAQGNDRYYGEQNGANGGSRMLSFGALVDLSGVDYYEDHAIPEGNCIDCTILLKEEFGSQIDFDDLIPN